jgi:hypothetical protein
MSWPLPFSLVSNVLSQDCAALLDAIKDPERL